MPLSPSNRSASPTGLDGTAPPPHAPHAHGNTGVGTAEEEIARLRREIGERDATLAALLLIAQQRVAAEPALQRHDHGLVSATQGRRGSAPGQPPRRHVGDEEELDEIEATRAASLLLTQERAAASASHHGDHGQASAAHQSRRTSATGQLRHADEDSAAIVVIDAPLSPIINPHSHRNSAPKQGFEGADTASMSDEQLARYLQAQENALALEPRRDGAHISGADANNAAPNNSSHPVPSHGTTTAPPTAAGSSNSGYTQAAYTSSSIANRLPHASRVPALGTAGITSNSRTGGAPSSTRARQVDADAAFAASLQQMEMFMAVQAPRGGDEEDPDARAALDDPVWGRFESAPGKPFKPHVLLGIAMCPCCVPPCCTPVRSVAWRKFCVSASFILGIIQIAVWIASLCFRGFAPPEVNPMLGCWPDSLDKLQAKNAAAIVYRYELWRLVTPIFLHAGLIHLATNMAMQLRMGVALEYEWGMLHYVLIYFGSGIFASVFSSAIKPDQLGVGASGALMGVFGAWIVHLVLHWGQGDENDQRARGFQFVMCIVNVVITLSFSFIPLIDWAAHLFGLLGGIFLGMWLFGLKEYKCAAGPVRATPDPVLLNALPFHDRVRHAQAAAVISGSRTSGTTSAPPATSRRRLLITAVVGLFLFLGIMLAGLLGLYLNTTPDRSLLDVCPLVQQAYPSYNLKC